MLLLSSGCDQAGGELDQLPFVAREGRLQRSTAGGDESLLFKGVNLGVAVRDTRAGELAATREQHYRWLARMGEIGLSSIRVYTLHYPRFYEAVRDHDLSHPASLDLAKIDTRGAPAGYFATYHAYPCYPDFIFAWVDAWRKRTWIVDDLNLPRDRHDIWHNVTSPEDNFRVIGFAAASRALETAESDGVVATFSLGGEVVSASPFLRDEWDTVDPWVESEKGSPEVFAEALGRSPSRGRGDGAWGPVRRC